MLAIVAAPAVLATPLKLPFRYIRDAALTNRFFLTILYKIHFLHSGHTPGQAVEWEGQAWQVATYSTTD